MNIALTDLPTARALWGSRADPAAAAAKPFALLDGETQDFSYTLLLRFALVNTLGLAFLGAAILAGWVVPLVVGDATGITALIIGVFVAGLAVATAKTWRLSRELNWVRSAAPPRHAKVAAYLRSVRQAGTDSRSLLASTLRLRLATRIGVVRQIGATLVMLGLIGTVVGFIIALSGIEPQAAADASAIGPMVSTLIDGMGTALSTTLVGAVLNIWLMVNYQLLASGTVNLIAGIIDRGECHARA